MPCFDMHLDAIFSFANLAVLPGWMLIAIAPRWRWSQRYAALLGLCMPGYW